MKYQYQLRSCVWELTLACCFNCKYCGSSGGQARSDELNTQECLEIVSQLQELGCEHVSLIGGEVFLRADWAVITEALVRCGIHVSIITNGFLFTDELIAKIKQIGLESIAISLDGPEAVHDKYRQQGSFHRAEVAIHKLVENGIPTSVISTLNRENVDHLEEIYQMLCRWGIRIWQLQACSPMGNAKDGIPYVFDHAKVIRFVESHMFEAPFSMGIADNMGYYTEVEGFLRGNLSGRAVFTGCSAGLTAIGIDSVGNIRGCESMYDERFIEGNIRQKTLYEIWEDPNAFRYNRSFTPELLTGKCSNCDKGSFCAGGCRGYNYFVHGMLYEAPFCVKNTTRE